ERVAQLVAEQGQELVLGLTRPPQLGRRGPHCGLGALAVDELPDLAAHDGEELEERLVRAADGPAEELDDPGDFAPAGDRETEGGMQALPGGDRRAGEVRIQVDVGDPGRLARGPYPAGQADAAREAVLARDGDELGGFEPRDVPHLDAPELLASGVHDPQR